MPNQNLSEKQQAFVREFLVDHNATKAAQRAGYSERTAYSQGQRLLKKAEIMRAIVEQGKTHIETVEVTPEFVLSVLKREANGEGPDTNSAARIKATELLAKHLAMSVGTNKFEHSGRIDGNGERKVTIEFVRPQATDDGSSTST